MSHHVSSLKMYKQTNKTFLEKSKNLVYWIKRKLLLIITAFMLGFYNVIYEEDKMINGNQHHIEQEQEEDEVS